MKALAVDLGGSHATCALVENTDILASRTVGADGAVGLKSLLPLLAETLKGIRGDGGNCGVAGVVFSFCGIVDYARGRILSTNAKFDDAPSLDLVAWCRERTQSPAENGE